MNEIDKKRKVLITNALPYANGELHLGHLVGYLQADFWKRFLILQGHSCVHICGSDVHGTPIMLHARSLGRTAEEIWEGYKQKHVKQLSAYYVNFDIWGDTDQIRHRKKVEEIYHRLVEGGWIYRKTIIRLYDPTSNIFLHDRMVKGICPFCKAPDQYGDACEACGKHYSAQELVNPYSVLTNTTPVLRNREHLFFKLSKFEYIFDKASDLRKEFRIWQKQSLQDWCISRDEPYYGIPIPETKQYFYVWFDALISYFSFIQDDDIWDSGNDWEIYQFIGKDIKYFHNIFWIAILEALHKKWPSEIIVHGFLCHKQKKISKSRQESCANPSIEDALTHNSPEVFRFYLAHKSRREMSDIHFSSEAMCLDFNAIVVNKIVNLPSRASTFIEKYFAFELDPKYLHSYELHLSEAQDHHKIITQAYSDRNYHKVIQEVENIADRLNKQFNDAEPWVEIKHRPENVHHLCTHILQYFYNIVRWLAPILPDLYNKSKVYLKDASTETWQNCIAKLTSKKTCKFVPLAKRAQ